LGSRLFGRIGPKRKRFFPSPEQFLRQSHEAVMVCVAIIVARLTGFSVEVGLASPSSRIGAFLKGPA
jgi:hypothetical protein